VVGLGNSEPSTVWIPSNEIFGQAQVTLLRFHSLVVKKVAKTYLEMVDITFQHHLEVQDT